MPVLDPLGAAYKIRKRQKPEEDDDRRGAVLQ